MTSGIPSPTLGKNIAMGYVQNAHHKKNMTLAVEVRKRMRQAAVTPMPRPRQVLPQIRSIRARVRG